MNQREIANELGVSQTTVSMVLNNPNTEKVANNSFGMLGNNSVLIVKRF